MPTLALAAASGIALGSINALLTYYLRVASIIVTIATSSIYYALLIYFTDAHRDLQPARLVGRAGSCFFRYVTASGDIVRITLPIVVMVAVVAAHPAV